MGEARHPVGIKAVAVAVPRRQTNVCLVEKVLRKLDESELCRWLCALAVRRRGPVQDVSPPGFEVSRRLGYTRRGVRQREEPREWLPSMLEADPDATGPQVEALRDIHSLTAFTL